MCYCEPAGARRAACDCANKTAQGCRPPSHHPTILRPHGHLAVPEIKAYMQDIVPGVRVDPEERIVLLRKGGVVRP